MPWDKKMIQISVSITNRCNMKCKMCDIGNRDSESSGLYKNWMNKKELEYYEWHYIFNKLNPDLIRIDGVEPLLYDKLDLLLEGVPNTSYLALTTNGWYIDKWFDCLKSECSAINVSIDGLEKTHDFIRGVPGAFERAFNGALKLKESGVAIRVSYAISPHNISDMLPLYRTLSDAKISMVFNHYNIVYPESCKIDFDNNCEIKPSNIYYSDDLRNIDVDLLYEQVKKCSKASFLPNLATKEEIEKYYHEIPTLRKCNGICRILKEVINGERYIISSDGSFVASNRCWINLYFGNALEYNKYQNLDRLRDIAYSIEKKGFHPACQRLCCAGKIL